VRTASPAEGRAALPESPARLLDIRGLTVDYSTAREQRVALRDVDLRIGAGELLGLVGPNGSGKTTLIRAVTNVVRPLAGEILIGGDNGRSLSQRELAQRLAVVPQDPVLPDGFSALDCVMMGRTPHLRLLQNEGAADYEAAQRAMRLTDTCELAERHVGELSGGERQRVVVARALAQETPVLLLDEPTAHLDIGHQARVLELMLSLCREQGKAVLAVVHDLALAALYCDRLVMLRAGGTVAAEGRAADILTPELLAEIYATCVDVFPHPQTGRPVVAPRLREG